MAIKNTNVNQCEIKQPSCLLKQAASGDTDIDEDSVCTHCNQSLEQIENGIDQVGRRLAEDANAKSDQFQFRQRLDEALVDESKGQTNEYLQIEAFVNQGESTDDNQQPILELKNLIGDIKIIREIGRGGMGIVYLARQVALHRDVAVKLLKQTSRKNDSQIQRFKAEAKAAARLDHPNIIPVFDSGEIDGKSYFIMAYVEGSSLANVLADNVLTEREMALVLLKICDAIEYAHHRGVIHRDLKPSNIIIDKNGEPHVADFGLAKLIDSDDDMTMSGMALGTPAYMPPEQASGKRAQASFANDVYSIGAILYRMLSGGPPFHGSTPIDVLKQVIEKNPIPPTQLNPEANWDLQTICLKCLEKDPENRYSTAQEVSDELKRYIENRPIVARPLGKVQRFVRLCKRNPGAFTAVSTIIASLVLGMIVSAFFALQSMDRERIAKESLDRAEILLYDATMPTAQRLIGSGQTDVAVGMLDECNSELAGWEMDFLRLSANKLEFECIGMTALSVTGDGKKMLVGYVSELGCKMNVYNLESGKTVYSEPVPISWCCDISADGGMIAYTFDDPGNHGNQLLKVVDINSKQPVFESTLNHQCRQVKFSNNGKELFVVSENNVLRFDISSAEQNSVLNSETINFNQLMQLDENRLATTGLNHNSILIWDLETGEKITELSGPENSISDLTFDKKSSRLVACDRKNIYVWENFAPNVALTLPVESDAICCSFFAEGKYLATGHVDNRVRLWDLKSKSVIGALSGHNYVVSQIVTNPASNKLITRQPVVVGSEVAIKVWNINAILHQRQFSNEYKSHSLVAVAPDSKRIAITASPVGGENESGLSIEVRNLNDFGLVKTFLLNEDTYVSWIQFSSDGKKLNWNENEHLWVEGDLKTGEVNRNLHVSAERYSVQFSPSGKFVVSAFSNTAIEVRDVKSKRVLTKSPIPKNEVMGGFAFSPDERFVYCGMLFGGLLKIDLSNGETESHPTHDLDDISTYDVTYSPDHTYLATAAGRSIQLWDAKTMRLVRKFNGHSNSIRDMCFSPDNKRIASIALDGTLRIWNVKTGKELMRFSDFAHCMTCSFTNDGKHVIANDSQKVMVYSAAVSNN